MSASKVRQVALELFHVCRRYENDPAALITAITWLAVSACMSFDIDTAKFIESYQKMSAAKGELVDLPTIIGDRTGGAG